MIDKDIGIRNIILPQNMYYNKHNKNTIKIVANVVGAGVYFGDNEYMKIIVEGSNERKIVEMTKLLENSLIKNMPWVCTT